MDKPSKLDLYVNKLLETERKVMLIKKIKAWLEDEVNQYEKYTFDDNHDVADEDVYLSKGRHECAEGLYNQIEKWENENVNK